MFQLSSLPKQKLFFYRILRHEFRRFPDSLEIPEAMLETQQRQMVDEFAQRITMQGMSMEQYMQFTGATYEKMIEQVKPQAEERIRARLVLAARRIIYFLSQKDDPLF